MAKQKGLNARQKLFCDEYLIDLNATQAAIRAGYSEKYANTNASKLLQNTTIAEYIAQKQAAREKRTEITQDMVLREIANIAFSNAADYVQVIEKDATAEIDGKMIAILDGEGNRVKYKTVEPVLTAELSKEQQKALSIIKRGRDGFEVRPYDKLKALELLGRHLGMWDKKEEEQAEKADDGFIDALRNEAAEIWEE